MLISSDLVLQCESFNQLTFNSKLRVNLISWTLDTALQITYINLI